MPQPSERTALYRLYDADAQLLYVGISKDPGGRWQAHQWGPERRPWIREVARQTVEWLPSRSVALDAAAAAIKAERPKYNGKHNYNEAPFDPNTWPTGTAHRRIPAIAELMRTEIAAGQWGIGQRIPSLRTLAAAAGVSKRVVSKASVLLQDEGILDFRPGHGLFVAQPPGTLCSGPAPGGESPTACPAGPATDTPDKGRIKLPHDWPQALGFPG